MRLTELEPEWVADFGPLAFTHEPLTIDTAQGILFQSPTDRFGILCWFRDRGVPDDAVPGPGRWKVTGTGFDDLTLWPSVDVSAGGKHPGRWHGWVRDGEVT
jgi:hypothetical protein